MKTRTRSYVFFAAVVLAAACSSKDTTGPGTPGNAVNIVKVSGDSQSVPYAAALPQPLVVKLTDAAGAPVNGAPTAWVLLLDGAAMTEEITTSGSNGETQISPTMDGVPGAYSIIAAINGQSVTFTGISNVTLAPGLQTMAGGLFANCGIATNGAAFCWGSNITGQLGAPPTGPHVGPMPVAGGLTFTQVSLGSFATCAVATSGALYCWGDPTNSVFGNGTAPGGSVVLTPIAAGSGRKFTEVSVGMGQSCGMSSGAVYCWGHNSKGELGTGDTVHHWSPVASEVPSGVTFTSVVVASVGVSCALSTTGAAYCWGYNGTGALGTGSSSPAYSTDPLLVTGGHTFTALAAAYDGICGLTSAGAVFCWGSGVNGNGSAGSEYAPTAISQGSVQFTQISASAQHACALTAAGAAYCWGDNYEGDLGTGSLTRPAGAVAVTGGHVFSTIIAAGLSTCGYTTSKVMLCWGSNSSRQLGLDASADTMYLAPVPVPGMAGH